MNALLEAVAIFIASLGLGVGACRLVVARANRRRRPRHLRLVTPEKK